MGLPRKVGPPAACMRPRVDVPRIGEGAACRVGLWVPDLGSPPQKPNGPPAKVGQRWLASRQLNVRSPSQTLTVKPYQQSCLILLISRCHHPVSWLRWEQGIRGTHAPLFPHPWTRSFASSWLWWSFHLLSYVQEVLPLACYCFFSRNAHNRPSGRPSPAWALRLEVIISAVVSRVLAGLTLRATGHPLGGTTASYCWSRVKIIRKTAQRPWLNGVISCWRCNLVLKACFAQR